MHRKRKRAIAPDAGTLEIGTLAGQRRMLFVQLDGSRILAAECKCLASVPTIDCPVEIHQIRAFQILVKGEPD